MKQHLLILLLFLLCFNAAVSAQPYMQKKTQHRFAQTYLGLNTQVTPSQGSMFWNGQTYSFPSMASPRFTIGGLHFWGKVDFNVNIPLITFSDFSLDESTEFTFNPGSDLSTRYYPWRMEYGKVRPYAGVSINTLTISINNDVEGSRKDLFLTTSLLGGISIAHNDWQVNTELMWLPNNERSFYSDRSNDYTLELPRSYLSFGIVKYFDATLREEADLQSGRMEQLESMFREQGKLNSFSIAAAPSGSYFLQAPPLDGPVRQSLPRHKASFVWDFGVGYLFHDAGIHLGISYRDYTSRVESYDFEHLIRRSSFSFEPIKFLLNYNGFVPFIGPSISFERWATGEFEGNTKIGDTQKKQMISPGIIFGWDILASPLETWVLRTNLRYYPFQKIRGTDGNISRVDQFEFNLIQVVIYPNRLFNYPKIKGRV